MGSQLVPKSVTSNVLEWPNGRHHAVSQNGSFRSQLLQIHCS